MGCRVVWPASPPVRHAIGGQGGKGKVGQTPRGYEDPGKPRWARDLSKEKALTWGDKGWTERRARFREGAESPDLCQLVGRVYKMRLRRGEGLEGHTGARWKGAPFSGDEEA